jgi:hypothetical protein
MSETQEEFDKRVQRGRWLRAVERYGGGFLQSFLMCWRTADDANQRLLLPAFDALMEKYPEYLSEAYQKGVRGERDRETTDEETNRG